MGFFLLSVGGDSHSISKVEAQRGQKRPNMASAFSKVELKSRASIAGQSKNSLVSAGAPLCRPWDRGDFQKRLSTFKSMTWFAKPQVHSSAYSFSFFYVLIYFLFLRFDLFFITPCCLGKSEP